MAQVLNYPKRPRPTNWAVWLLYIAACLGILKYIFIVGVAPDEAVIPTVVTFNFALELAIWLTFTFIASIGHRWASFVIALLVAFNVFGAVYGIHTGVMQADMFVIVTNILQVIGSALFFLRPSIQWFADMKVARRELKIKMKAEAAERTRRLAEHKAKAKADKERAKLEKQRAKEEKAQTKALAQTAPSAQAPSQSPPAPNAQPIPAPSDEAAAQSTGQPSFAASAQASVQADTQSGAGQASTSDKPVGQA